MAMPFFQELVMQDNTSQVIHQFLNLEKEARSAQSLRELSFVMSNLTKRLLPFSQAFVWKKSIQGYSVESISAISNVNHKSPYIVWLEKVLIPRIAKLNLGYNTPLLTPDACPDIDEMVWQEHINGHLMVFQFRALSSGETIAGICFISSMTWSEVQLGIAQDLIEHYHHCWQRLLHQQKEKRFKRFLSKQKINRLKIAIVVTIFASFFIPVQQTVLAPAEVSAKDPHIVSASIEGIIQTIHVQPNQMVSKGQILFSLDPISLINSLKQAQKELSVTEEKYRRAFQHAYTDPKSKAELAVLKSEVEKAQNELTYRKALLERSHVKAQFDGIVIFSSPKDWLGKPIQVGQQVMLLTQENNKLLEVDIPQSDMIEITPNSQVKFFPDISPLSPIKAKVRYASFIASSSAQGELNYYVACEFEPGFKIPRFGAHGSAKIYGQDISLFFYLFRRPIIYIQSLMGI